MKQLIIRIIILLGLLAIPLIWWEMQSPVSSGVYPEKHAGSVSIEIEEDATMMEFQLPVQWIKSHPWEEPPVLEDIKLLDQNGELIAAIKGKYQLKVDANQDKWNNRNLKAEIEFYINGERFSEGGGITSTSFSRPLQDAYVLDQLNLTYEEEKISFPMDNTYKIIPIPKTNHESLSVWEMERFTYLYDFEMNRLKGYIVELKGSQNSTLEEILFWYPGMSNDYFNTHVLYSIDGNMDQYLNDSDTFKGEALSLPLDLNPSSLLLYFPITQEIQTNIEESIVWMIPYFKFTDKENHMYYTGGTGSVGPFDTEKEWDEHLVKPK